MNIGAARIAPAHLVLKGILLGGTDMDEMEAGCQAPELDPTWAEIARLEKSRRTAEARRLEERWLARHGACENLLDGERFFDID